MDFAFITNIIVTADLSLPVSHLGKIITLGELFSQSGHSHACVATYNVFNQALGHTVLINLTAEQCFKNPKFAREVILEACRYAQGELDARVIAFGSFTKEVVKNVDYLKENGITVPMTHGDTYSAASGIKGVEMMIKEFNLVTPTIAVIGAYGIIGRAMTLTLENMGYNVIAMGRNQKNLESLASEGTTGRIRITRDLSYALNNSQLVVMATSSPSSVITESLLESFPGGQILLYDIAQPYNLFPDDFWKLNKKGYRVVRADGGIVGVNRSLDIKFTMRLPQGWYYGCFAELIMQALEEDYTNHIGPVDLAYLQVMSDRAKKWGFHHQPLSCYNEPLEKVMGKVADIQSHRAVTV